MNKESPTCRYIFFSPNNNNIWLVLDTTNCLKEHSLILKANITFTCETVDIDEYANAYTYKHTRILTHALIHVHRHKHCMLSIF